MNNGRKQMSPTRRRSMRVAAAETGLISGRNRMSITQRSEGQSRVLLQSEGLLRVAHHHAVPQERPLNTNGGHDYGAKLGASKNVSLARGEAPRVPAVAAPTVPSFGRTSLT
jgi:hypothetical protein